MKGRGSTFVSRAQEEFFFSFFFFCFSILLLFQIKPIYFIFCLFTVKKQKKSKQNNEQHPKRKGNNKQLSFLHLPALVRGVIRYRWLSQYRFGWRRGNGLQPNGHCGILTHPAAGPFHCLIFGTVGGEKKKKKEIWCTSTDIYYAAHTRYRAGSTGSSSWIVTNSLVDLLISSLSSKTPSYITKTGRSPLFSGFFQSIELLSFSSLPLDGTPFQSCSIKSVYVAELSSVLSYPFRMMTVTKNGNKKRRQTCFKRALQSARCKSGAELKQEEKSVSWIVACCQKKKGPQLVARIGEPRFAWSIPVESFLTTPTGTCSIDREMSTFHAVTNEQKKEGFLSMILTIEPKNKQCTTVLRHSMLKREELY